MVRQQAHGQGLGDPGDMLKWKGQHPGGRMSQRMIEVAKEVNSGQNEQIVPSCSEGNSFSNRFYK